MISTAIGANGFSGRKDDKESDFCLSVHVSVIRCVYTSICASVYLSVLEIGQMVSISTCKYLVLSIEHNSGIVRYR